MDKSSWTPQGATAICVGGENGKEEIGVVPFKNPKNSNTPDTSFVPMMKCVNPEVRKKIRLSAEE